MLKRYRAESRVGLVVDRNLWSDIVQNAEMVSGVIIVAESETIVDGPIVGRILVMALRMLFALHAGSKD